MLVRNYAAPESRDQRVAPVVVRRQMQHCVDPSTGLCCPNGQVKLGGGCCPPQNICGTVCCENGTCLDAITSKCCSGFGVMACGSACCDPNSICISAARSDCCARELACGSVCCSPGQICGDPSTGTCKASGCPPGQVPTQCPTQHAGSPPQVVSVVCCPQGSQCCDGKCCTRRRPLLHLTQ